MDKTDSYEEKATPITRTNKGVAGLKCKYSWSECREMSATRKVFCNL